MTQKMPTVANEPATTSATLLDERALRSNEDQS
jgi:hypothetical protein